MRPSSESGDDPYGLMRRGPARIIGVMVAGLLLVTSIMLAFVEHDPTDVLIAVGVVVVLAAARRAFRVRVEWPRARRPAHPVLFYNPRSGGGKAERFALAEASRSRGIEPIELRPGDDLEQLVRDAVSRGADALAMAGGDGSQAIVAMVAAELDLPHGCIPSGTRNHFALDLGVDRDDVVGALDAFVNGGERRVDLAEVNGQVFVNNVSLGLYAEAVRRPGYREAKIRPLLDTIPDARGLLGIAALGPTRAARNGAVRLTLGMQQWTALTIEMHADERVPVGIDGEAIHLDPPLHFRIRPGALRVRIASAHPGASPSALVPDKPWGLLQALTHVALSGTTPELLGRPSQSD